MVFSKNWLLQILLQILLVIFPLLVQAQDQAGSISIDCGLTDVTSYTDDKTGINYVSDANFTEYGENRVVSPTTRSKTDEQQLWNVRSFPQGTRNCYTMRPSQPLGTRYLIRARFMYGNYDKLDHAPKFALHIGVDLWDTVDPTDPDTILNKEIIYKPLSALVHVCLVNTGFGIPFISVLELRPLSKNDIYETQNNERSLLQLWDHYDFSSTTNAFTRYKDDVYGRIWYPLNSSSWYPFIKASASNENSILKNDFELPGAVMGTAYTVNQSTGTLNIHWPKVDASIEFFFYMHFAELEILQANQTREFDIFINGDLWYEKVVPRYLKVNSVYKTTALSPSKGTLDIWLNNTRAATLPPLINAMEMYMLKDLSGQDTNQADVEAILGVKSTYELKRIKWQGDPCGGKGYEWDGLTCSYSDGKLSRIVSLNLSTSELKGVIIHSIANLVLLEKLDLSNNNLTGEVPEFLLHLSSLKVLNLKGNNFTGFPNALLSKNGLQFSIDSHSDPGPLCSSRPCSNKKHFVVPLVSALGGALVIILIAVVVICIFKKKKIQQKGEDVRARNVIDEMPMLKEEDDAFGSKKQKYTYSELERITRNFKTVLGEGGFGKVYHGYLNGNQVAVKMLSSPSIQGHRQFHTELKLLLRVHHKNLTTLVGYCNEPANVGLIYEYMAMGNLRSHLSGGRRSFLTWEDRLRIAIDAAQGLEYMHNGCKPPIIHRDVKSTNILLNEKFQAKLGDFGLSKIFPSEDGNHISAFSTPGIATSIAGTPGYLDPEYYSTNWLNEKSDVYSFGIVLLELITARPVLTETQPCIHIIHWVSLMVKTGDVDNILDQRLRGSCDINTVWKAIEISIASVSKSSSDRPTMSRVTTELKECLTSELARKESRNVVDFSKDSSFEMMSRTLVSEFSPQAR